MPVRSSALGSLLPPRTIEVTTRMTLAYAAGVGEVGDRTFDDAREGLLAPPAFCVVLEWPVVSTHRAPLLGLTDDERRRLVHVEQDSRFHRPIRPGDLLRTGGRIVEIRATSAGTLVRFVLATVEMTDHVPVVTTSYALMCRDVSIDGDGGTSEDAPRWPEPTAGVEERVHIPIPRQAAHVYTECSGIWNPIHSERRAALAAGLPDVILHGTATWALAGRELLRLYGEGDPLTLRRLRARFTRPVIPGRAVALVHCGSSSGRHVHFTVRDADDQVVVDGGFAAFHAPHEEPRR